MTEREARRPLSLVEKISAMKESVRQVEYAKAPKAVPPVKSRTIAELAAEFDLTIEQVQEAYTT